MVASRTILPCSEASASVLNSKEPTRKAHSHFILCLTPQSRKQCRINIAAADDGDIYFSLRQLIFVKQKCCHRDRTARLSGRFRIRGQFSCSLFYFLLTHGDDIVHVTP